MAANFIGIRRIYYGDIIAEGLTPATLKTWLSTAKTVENSHDGTWAYNQDDPASTDYKNEMTGEIYHTEITDKGKKSVSWVMGSYTLEQKAELQGGEAIKGTGSETIGWKSAEETKQIYKGLAFLANDGSIGVFTNANIVAKTTAAEKILGLSVTATATSNPTKGVRDEYWFKAGAGFMPDED